MIQLNSQIDINNPIKNYVQGGDVVTHIKALIKAKQPYGILLVSSVAGLPDGLTSGGLIYHEPLGTMRVYIELYTSTARYIGTFYETEDITGLKWREYQLVAK